MNTETALRDCVAQDGEFTVTDILDAITERMRKAEAACVELEADKEHAIKVSGDFIRLLHADIAELKARAIRAEAALAVTADEPLCFAVVMKTEGVDYTAPVESMCHDHINEMLMCDALDPDHREEYATARVIPLYTRPSAAPEGFVIAPNYRGYALLGSGQYFINHSRSDFPAELIISVAREEERRGLAVGDITDNPDGTVLMPENMAVRIGFTSESGLNALEDQLRLLREAHFPKAMIAAAGKE